MKDQFLGKAFFLTLTGLTLAFFVAYFSLHTGAETVFLLLIGLATLLLATHKLEYGLYIALAELIGTSHGHLFTAGGISIRMAIFGAVMIAWLTHLARGRRVAIGANPWDRPYILLLISIIIGFVVGLRGADTDVIKNVINDGNGYFYVLYIFPMLTVNWDAIKRRVLLQVFAGAATFISVLTLLILYLFTHTTEPVQRALYAFFRDARIAELTKVTGDIFRIFLQAQFFSVVLLLVIAAAMFWFWRQRRDQTILALWFILTMSALIISLSRSFWIGLIVGGLTLAVSAISIRRPSIKEILVKKAAGLLMLITSVALLWVVLAFPLPRPANVSGFGDLLSDRTLDGGDAAISSRWNLLPEMQKTIAESPIIGSGFGKIIAFESDDPRVREIYPDGKWRTYAFEWGWLDLWIKMGLLGPIAMIWLGLSVGFGLVRGFRDEHGWLNIGLFAGLVALYAIHTFSPYLNHPIGLGYIIFLTPFLVAKKQKAHEGAMVAIRGVIEKTIVHTPAQIPKAPSVSSRQAEPVPWAEV